MKMCATALLYCFIVLERLFFDVLCDLHVMAEQQVNPCSHVLFVLFCFLLYFLESYKFPAPGPESG